MIEDDFESEEQRPSKSERKREMLALQALGEQLVTLPDGDLARIEMPAELADAVATARRIKSHEGRRRQLQYIGKLMRRIDAEPIASALQAREQGQRELARQFHHLEAMRDRLIAEGASAVDEVLAQFPGADRQQLRQLVLRAQKERDAGHPPASSRKLFRYLRELAESDINRTR